MSCEARRGVVGVPVVVEPVPVAVPLLTITVEVCGVQVAIGVRGNVYDAICATTPRPSPDLGSTILTASRRNRRPHHENGYSRG